MLIMVKIKPLKQSNDGWNMSQILETFPLQSKESQWKSCFEILLVFMDRFIVFFFWKAVTTHIFQHGHSNNNAEAKKLK